MNRTIKRQFSAIFLSIALLLIGVVAAILYNESRIEQNQLSSQGTRLAAVNADVITNDFKIIISDLRTVSAHNQFHSLLNNLDTFDRRALANELLAFSTNRKMYDQVRYLDNAGMEIIRVDFHNGNPVVVPDAQLQNKGDRYYFTDTIKLNQGDIFISPFDLNIENGKIEEPLKPMLRVAMPMFDNAGNKKGILILNYLGYYLFENLARLDSAMNSSASVLLLNQQGYWLKGMKPQDEWGFMFKDEKRTIAQAFPQAWASISKQDSGQFVDADGLFTFRTIHPLPPGTTSSTGLTEAVARSAAQLEQKAYFWKLVVFVPTNQLTKNAHALFNKLVPFLLMALLLSGVAVYYLARFNAKQAEADDQIKHMAHFDTLTGLPNRVLFFDRVGQFFARSERHKESFALLFIDLDGFKLVNDVHGHEVGDAVLKEAAHRIRSLLRKVDTPARIGGDEFLVALSELHQPEDAGTVAKKIIMALAQPILVSGKPPITIGASVGIAIYPSDAQEIEALIKCADEAMYEAKHAGKNDYRFNSHRPSQARPTYDGQVGVSPED